MFTQPQLSQCQRADPPAHQTQRRVSNCGGHVAKLALLALGQQKFQPDTLVGSHAQLQVAGKTLHDTHFCRRSAPFFQIDAAAQLLQLSDGWPLANQHKVCLGMLKTWVRQLVRQIAIVGEQHQPLAVQVEPTNWKDTAHFFGQQVDDGPTPTDVTAHIADHPARLVQFDVDMLFRQFQWFAIHQNARAGGVGARAEFGDHSTIHLHTPVGDQFFTRSAAAQPCRGHQFLQSFFCHFAHLSRCEKLLANFVTPQPPLDAADHAACFSLLHHRAVNPANCP
jgi:hypothetical protein